MRALTEKLTAKQELLIACLLKAYTVAEAAREVGTSEPTAYRWLAQPNVHHALMTARRRVLDTAVMGAQAASRVAIKTLLECMGKDQPPAVRVRAAMSVLDVAFRGVELDDLASRIGDLEAALEAQGNAPMRLHGA